MESLLGEFIDDRKTGFTSDSFATDAREGVYFRGSGDLLSYTQGPIVITMKLQHFLHLSRVD